MTTITLPRATVEQALEALELVTDLTNHDDEIYGAITALRAALAQQAEPVACCDLEERKALSSVKLPCDVRIGHGTHRKGSSLLALVVRSRSLYQMAKSDDYYGYASRLAVAIWEKHYKDAAPQWTPLDDLMGVLTQIDNMTSGLTRLAQQAEPVEPVSNEALRLAGLELIGLAEHDQHCDVFDLDDQGRHKACTCGLNDAIAVITQAGKSAPPQQAEPDHETRAELAEQQVVQLAEERDHYRNLWQKAQQAEPVEPVAWVGDPSTQDYASTVPDPQIEDRLARHGIPKP